MSELKHWLDEASDADEFERAILRAGLDVDPPAAKQEQVWSGLMATIAVIPLAAANATAQAVSAPTAAAGLSKAAAVWLSVAKGFLVGLAVYGAAAGVSEISARLSPSRPPAPGAQRANEPARAVSRVTEPAQTTSALVRAPAREDAKATHRLAQRTFADASLDASAHASPQPSAVLPSVASFDFSEPPSSAQVSLLDAETRALRRARDELRAGKLSAASATLEAARRQFSAPELYQEREALTIELLHRSGQVIAAEQRARAFISRFPESPHVQQMRQFAGK